MSPNRVHLKPVYDHKHTTLHAIEKFGSYEQPCKCARGGDGERCRWIQLCVFFRTACAHSQRPEYFRLLGKAPGSSITVRNYDFSSLGWMHTLCGLNRNRKAKKKQRQKKSTDTDQTNRGLQNYLRQGVEKSVSAKNWGGRGEGRDHGYGLDGMYSATS